MKRSHQRSSRVANRRPRGGGKAGRARNRLSKKGRRSTSHREFSGEIMQRDENKLRRGSEKRESHRSPPEAAPEAVPDAGDAERSESPTVPLYIRATGTHFSAHEREYTQRKLDQKLGKFDRSIERVSIRIDDVNGPRGGVDQKCRMKVVLTGQPSVIVESQRSQAHAAVDAAIQSAEKTVRRTVRRRRMKPLRAAAS